MKKTFRKILTFILLGFMLFSVAFFDIGKNENGQQRKNETETASATYDFEGDGKFVDDLLNSTENIETKYDLTKQYPMISENQKDSSFCWIYSSMKSLESSLMVQKSEYYNFSETALAYMYYDDSLDSNSSSVFNVSGNFETFAECYQKYGLVLESDFSNDEYYQISKGKNYDYDYVKDFASKDLNASFKPYLLGVNAKFSDISLSQTKIGVVKRFIKKYGAVFAGIDGGASVGCFYLDTNITDGNGVYSGDIYTFYDRDRSSHKDKRSYEPLNENHAITIVGWNDDIVFDSEQGAFIVMNSWGFEEKSINFFYVPYSYTSILNTTRGFICTENTSEVISTESSSDSTFANDFMTGSKKLNNFFAYDNEVWVNYKINLSSLDNLEIEIFSGEKSYKKLFSISSDNDEKTIKLELSNKAEFYGGYFTIRFINNGELLGNRGIYIYSGTEINYFKGRTARVFDTYLLDNTFVNLDNSVNINASSVAEGSEGAYFFEFRRSPISQYSFIKSSNKGSAIQDLKPDEIVSMEVSDVEIVSSSNKALETAYTQEVLTKWVIVPHFESEEGNLFRLQIGNPAYGYSLALFDNCLIRFKFSVNSIIYENCKRDYVVNVFVSNRLNADSMDLYSVSYELDGGENNERNISKYPIYNPAFEGDTNCDELMTKVELLSPEKMGYTFLGWFLDKDFTRQVTKFDSSLSGNITLYAKWESINENYFDISLRLVNIYNYGKKATKSLSDTIIYGDSIVIGFDFKSVYLSNYSADSYVIQYYFYGTELVGDYLVGNYKQFNLDFPSLESGEHIFKIKVKVTINGVLEVSEETAIAVSVAKKNVVFGFENLSKVYNGQNQKPDVVMEEDFYGEDCEGIDKNSLFNLTCGVDSKDVNSYNFYISGINNKNYTFDASADSSKCVFEITKKSLTFKWKEYNHTYDGTNHFPEYELFGLIDGDSVEFSFNLPECKNAGEYKINVLTNTISNKNYTVGKTEEFEFEIKKAEVMVIMHNTTDRMQTKYEKRKTPQFTVVGNYYSVEDLQIVIVNEAKYATRSGKYDISCVITNTNYVAVVKKASYELTGYYNVYYLLSNGKSYVERVEEGDDPVGVTKEQLGVSKFSKISYSDDFVVTGDDLYVEVEYKDYTFIVYSGIVALVGAVVCFVIYLKKRGSSVR